MGSTEHEEQGEKHGAETTCKEGTGWQDPRRLPGRDSDLCGGRGGDRWPAEVHRLGSQAGHRQLGSHLLAQKRRSSKTSPSLLPSTGKAVAPAGTGEMFAGTGSRMTGQQRRLGWGARGKGSSEQTASVLQSLWKMRLSLIKLSHHLLDGPVIPHS